MKKLKKILLINWLYFSKQLIEVEYINFLTGKNGAGKSTVIDALQIVLLGETLSLIHISEPTRRTPGISTRPPMKSPSGRWTDICGPTWTAVPPIPDEAETFPATSSANFWMRRRAAAL